MKLRIVTKQSLGSVRVPHLNVKHVTGEIMSSVKFSIQYRKLGLARFSGKVFEVSSLPSEMTIMSSGLFLVVEIEV